MAGKVNEKKRVPVKFIGDQDALETIVSTIPYSKDKIATEHENFLSFNDDGKDDLPPFGDGGELYHRPSVLLEEHDVKQRKESLFTASKNLQELESTSSDEDSDAGDVRTSSSRGKLRAKTDIHSSKSQDAKTPGKPFRNMAEEYFVRSSQKSATSNRGLSSASLVTDEEMLKKVKQLSLNPHAKNIQKLAAQYKDSFDKWNSLLRQGFNLLFYGYGSKYALISEFCQEMLRNSLHMVVNGFFPGMTIKHLLSTIIQEVMEDSSPYQGLNDKVNYIKEHFSSPDAPHFYLIVHNIDGTALQSKKAQVVLNQLAQATNIHFIASVDHVNCSLLWNQVMLTRFRWLWLEVTTFQPYNIETSYEDSLLAQHSGQLTLNSLKQVFSSLTSNAQGIFLTIASYQIEKSSAKCKYVGLSFQDCYLQCAEAFLVSSDLGLRTQLTEFRDHKLLQMRKGSDGVDYLYIPLDTDTLKQFVEENNVVEEGVAQSFTWFHSIIEP